MSENETTEPGVRWSGYCPCGSKAAVLPREVGEGAPAIDEITKCGLCHCHHRVEAVDVERHFAVLAVSTPDELRAWLDGRGVRYVAVICPWCFERNDFLREVLDDGRSVDSAVLMCNECDRPGMGERLDVDPAGTEWLILRRPTEPETMAIFVQMLTRSFTPSTRRLDVDALERFLADTDGGDTEAGSS